MKISAKNLRNQTTNHNNKLLTFELMGFKSYRLKNKKHFNNNLLTSKNLSFRQNSLHFKKVLQIIFKYHLNRKKILVIGEKKLIKNKIYYIHKKTNHVYMPKAAWVNGLLSNNNAIQLFLKKKNPLLKLVKKPRLIVLYEYWDLVDSESYSRRLVNMTLNNSPILKSKSSYNKNPMYVFVSKSAAEINKKKIHRFFSALIEKIIKLPKLKRQCFKLSFLYKKKRHSKKIYYNKKNSHKNKWKHTNALLKKYSSY